MAQLKANWTAEAWEDFFQKLDRSAFENDRINTDHVRCAESTIVTGENGVFAKTAFRKGEIIEWGVAVAIPGMNVKENDMFYTWDTEDRTSAATVSGCGLFYNTLGDKSNARCVPYHSENRFEVYALRDIEEGEELTFRYDSMNDRDGMAHLVPIVGILKKEKLES